MLALLFVLHFIADFPLQSREMGQKKSSEFKWLWDHLCIQLGIAWIGIVTWCWFDRATDHTRFLLLYPMLNAIVHGVIDWNIWKGYKWSAHKRIKRALIKEGYDGHVQYNHEYMYRTSHFKYWEDHLFYTTIGFDQLLHGLTIIFLYKWLV